MFERLAYLRKRLFTGFWFIPIALCAASFLLDLLMLGLNRHMTSLSSGLRVFALPVGSARQVLSVIAGSVISVGGVSFSVTMVALTLTSGQYVPKVLRHFLEDNDSKVGLALARVATGSLGSVFLDDDGKARLLVRFTGFQGILKAVFAQLRQFANADVTGSLSEALCRLVELTTRCDRPRLLATHGDLIWDGLDDQGFTNYDQRDIRQRYKRLQILVNRFDWEAYRSH